MDDTGYSTLRRYSAPYSFGVYVWFFSGFLDNNGQKTKEKLQQHGLHWHILPFSLSGLPRFSRRRFFVTFAGFFAAPPFSFDEKVLK